MRHYSTLRLRDALQAAAHLPFWKERLENSGVDLDSFQVSDLDRLPVLSKKDFRERKMVEYTDAETIRFAERDFTSGSTGQPFEFFFDRPAELRSFAICERMFRINAGGRYPVIGMRGRHKPGFAVHGHHMFYLLGSNSVKHRLHDLVEVAQRYPEGIILYGYTSAIIEVARQVQEQGGTMNIRAAIATGEALSAEQRALIEQTLKTKFFLNYASREMGWVGYECDHHSVHVNEEWAYLEIVDENGKAVKDGEEGAIVVTLFDNRTMPLIRYDSGDTGSVIPGPCPCGSALKRITLSGRKNDIIELADGRTVPLINLSASLDKYNKSLRQFQIVQTSPLEFTIKVIPGPGFEASRDNIRDQIVRLLHPSVTITWEIVEDIAPSKSGKSIYFVRALKNTP